MLAVEMNSVVGTTARKILLYASKTPLAVRSASLFLFLDVPEALVEYRCIFTASTNPTTKNSRVSARDSISSLVGRMDTVLSAAGASTSGLYCVIVFPPPPDFRMKIFWSHWRP
jgi:hypothetical protein